MLFPGHHPNANGHLAVKASDSRCGMGLFLVFSNECLLNTAPPHHAPTPADPLSAPSLSLIACTCLSQHIPIFMCHVAASHKAKHHCPLKKRQVRGVPFLNFSPITPLTRDKLSFGPVGPWQGNWSARY